MNSKRTHNLHPHGRLALKTNSNSNKITRMVQSSDPVDQWQGKRFGAEPGVAFESDVRACDGQRLGYTRHRDVTLLENRPSRSQYESQMNSRSSMVPAHN